VRAFLRRRANLLIGIPLGLAVGLLVAFFVVINSGRDTPTFSTTPTERSAPPASAEPAAPGPSGQRR
jgi:hypothetical protein